MKALYVIYTRLSTGTRRRVISMIRANFTTSLNGISTSPSSRRGANIGKGEQPLFKDLG